MIPLIQSTVEKPVMGCFDRVAIRFEEVHLCEVVTTGKRTDARLALGCSCESARQGITGQSLANYQEAPRWTI